MRNVFALAFALIIVFSLAACNNSSTNNSLDEQNIDTSGQFAERQNDNQLTDELYVVDSFIEKFNAIAPTPITDTTIIDVTDKGSGHYRTEFRLGAFKDSIAKTGTMGDASIDIVNCGWKKDELRIYADNITAEQAVEIVKYAAPIMDPDVPNDELQEVLDYLSGTNTYHNGYFWKLCTTFNESYGQLMLRTD